MIQRRHHPLVFQTDLDSVELDDANRRHLSKSLRLRRGDPFYVSDGAGSWREVALTDSGINHLGDVQLEPERTVPKAVAFTPVKGDRPSWVVQKLTELNIDEIVLIETERSVVRWDDDRKAKQLEKLHRVAVEACGQSRRVWFPRISFGSLGEVLVRPGAAIAEPGGRPITSSDTMVAIGPEGGWSEAELAMGDPVGLPGAILRAETAALTAAVILASHTE